MTSPNINPLGMVANLAIGWFVISFLQAVLRAIVSSNGPSLWFRFLDIAFFRDSTGLLVNAIGIVVLGGIGTMIWFLTKK